MKSSTELHELAEGGQRGKALVQLFLAHPLLSLCLTYACSLSLLGHKGIRPCTPSSFPVSLRKVPGLAKIQTESVILPAAFQLLYVLPQNSVFVCVSTLCVILSSLGLDLLCFS